MGFHRINIETDSQLMVSWIIKGEYNIWYLEDFWNEFKTCIDRLEYPVTHVFREENVRSS